MPRFLAPLVGSLSMLLLLLALPGCPDGPGAICEAGRQVSCACGETEGSQRCRDDGSGYEACACPDAGATDAAPPDAEDNFDSGPVDTGAPADTGVAPDTGVDSGVEPDTGVGADTGVEDVGPADTGTITTDAGADDAAITDADLSDGPLPDTGLLPDAAIDAGIDAGVDAGFDAGGPVCDNGTFGGYQTAICETCSACAETNYCGNQSAACGTGSQCELFLLCVSNCLDQSCVNSCVVSFPQGYGAYVDLTTCLFCQCPQNCDPAGLGIVCPPS